MSNIILSTTVSNLLIPTSRVFQSTTNNFVYTGGTPSFTVVNEIKNVISIKINGLEEIQNVGYRVIDKNIVSFNYEPVIPSNVTINYSY